MAFIETYKQIMKDGYEKIIYSYDKTIGKYEYKPFSHANTDTWKEDFVEILINNLLNYCYEPKELEILYNPNFPELKKYINNSIKARLNKKTKQAQQDGLCGELLIDLILRMENINNIPQRTFLWQVQRLGFFTGSEVGKLMVKSRKKDEAFGDTALTYIYRKMAERDLIEEVRTDEEVFNEYQYINSVSSRAMQWGVDNEPIARKLIIKELGETFEEVGSIPHPTVEWFSSSPDGLTPRRSMCLEIKCPSIETFMRYKCNVCDAAALKEENPVYYWQCMSHIACTGADVCVFVVFNPFLRHPLHWITIRRDNEAIKELETRVNQANDYINNILNHKEQ